jgi:hypothetical protein
MQSASGNAHNIGYTDALSIGVDIIATVDLYYTTQLYAN